ncbi:hypothetical protein [Thalassospira sp. TSL5-1]|uniref:hypothetical protein n=1 Tax=Thalassospira sp. TSL5-1 TaxID=1544451 RepID=UPI00093FA761|nr:hypothetical protein [Thalassospira sp. TSL5-1]OKH87095.1 hypothetical protein LF95_19085 [Thalassospira sp. TSL5-1]
MNYRGKLRALMLAGLASCVTTAAIAQTCETALRDAPMVPINQAYCASLKETVRHPGALPLNEYEAALSQFFNNWCHRDTEAGWVRDKYVRDTGPYTAARVAGQKGAPWEGTYHGTHSPVVIWYSPEMVTWLEKNRPTGKAHPEPQAAIPDGAIMVKEMYPQPAAACAKYDPNYLFPTSGAAIMVRDAQESKDGWFWGWYGWPGEGWAPDWPAGESNAPPNMGFGQYCVNCHGSSHDMTFAEERNMQGHPGQSEVFLSQDFFAGQYIGTDEVPKIGRTVSAAAGAMAQLEADGAGDSIHALRAHMEAKPVPHGQKRTEPLQELLVLMRNAERFGVVPEHRFIMPSQTYDNVWMPASGPSPQSQYLTSDQCTGCHDAGSTGLQFDMTMPDPQSDKLLNLSPYATWRSSPMGLAGRDPIFFAQMASETQTFHHDQADLVQTTCLGCHGILGQRQYQIDHAKDNAGDCGVFDRDIVNAVPYPPENPGAGHASYGALARDGISCMACHQMVLGKEATEKYADDPQNACVLKRQELINADNTGFGKTFTGSFLVGPAGKLFGPFDKPKTHPMDYTLGIKPEKGDAISTSEMCGTCHTVHLPVLHEGKTIAHVYEQTTYVEWAFSAYRTGSTIDGPLPAGAGAEPATCQDCHMPSRDAGGTFKSKIASIQEFSNFPAAANTFAPEDIDLEQREGFAKHTLVGLNLFLVKMFQQFPDVMGVPTADPMMNSKKAIDPLELTARAINQQAANATVSIGLGDEPVIANGKLHAAVSITSHTGHKFPSGVGFRRAFVNFEVLDARDKVIWASGRVNKAGVLVDQNQKPITGELWWDETCTARIEPEKRMHQPHYEVISHQDQTQIYQELVSTPPRDGSQFACGHNVRPQGELTTSFLSICAEVKDNRLPPPGYLGLAERTAISKALGAGADLAEDAGFTAVGADPDYLGPTEQGGDNLRYEISLKEIEGTPAKVRARLYYQATPPFYLQDRFCTAKGDDTDRLAYLAQYLNLDGTQAENWALKLVDTGPVRISMP